MGAPVAHPRGKSPANGRLPAPLSEPHPQRPSQSRSQIRLGLSGSRGLNSLSPGTPKPQGHALRQHDNKRHKRGDWAAVWCSSREHPGCMLSSLPENPWEMQWALAGTQVAFLPTHASFRVKKKKKKVIGLNGERGMVIVSSCIRHGGGAGRCLGMALITQ